MERARELSRASFLRALIPHVGAPPSRLEHFPKPHLLIPLPLGVRISTHKFREDTNIQILADIFLQINQPWCAILFLFTCPGASPGFSPHTHHTMNKMSYGLFSRLAILAWLHAFAHPLLHPSNTLSNTQMAGSLERTRYNFNSSLDPRYRKEDSCFSPHLRECLRNQTRCLSLLFLIALFISGWGNCSERRGLSVPPFFHFPSSDLCG